MLYRTCCYCGCCDSVNVCYALTVLSYLYPRARLSRARRLHIAQHLRIDTFPLVFTFSYRLACRALSLLMGWVADLGYAQSAHGVSIYLHPQLALCMLMPCTHQHVLILHSLGDSPSQVAKSLTIFYTGDCVSSCPPCLYTSISPITRTLTRL